MDIVFLIDNFGQGGAEVQLIGVAKRLHERGWKIGILTMIPSAAYLDEIKAAGIPLVECARGRTPFRMAFRMIRQLRRWRPSVLITFNYHADIMGRFCGRIARVPTIIASLRTAHVKTPLREKIYRLTESLIDLTTSNSQAAITYMLSRGILTPKKTVVIPNGIVPGDFPLPITRQEARAEFSLAPDTFVWLAVGNLLPAKDYPNLLEAAMQCAAASTRFKLFVIGGGESLAEMRAEVDQRGLTGVVVFLGLRSDVPRVLRACDAYVLSSAWEGMPNTVMEALASGVPVVATDVGGVRELVDPHVSGILVPKCQPESLAEGMLAMMTLEENARSQMGQSGRDWIKKQFDFEGVVDTWESEIQQIVAEKGLSLEKREPPSVEATAISYNSDAPQSPALPPPAFIVSLDFELLWGMRDKQSIQTYGENILGEREAIPAMLRVFRQYEVKATWATVGMLLFDQRAELLSYLPELRPSYARQKINPYLALDEIGKDEKSDPYHFGLSLARQILDCEGMEMGSHTFSHYYCLEQGQEASQFRVDLEVSAAVIERLTNRPVSLVFPRNQCNLNYLPICAELGFKVFRGNETAWMYRGARDERQSTLKRGTRLFDHYAPISGHNGFTPHLEGGLINCPSSRFLRPFSSGFSWLENLRVLRIKSAMEAAARNKKSFHLWWHPHNFGTNLKENIALLEELLRFHRTLRDRYGVVPMSMGDVARATWKAS